MPKLPNFELEDDPLWYKDAIIYEAHVRAFYDTNDDGMGDFRGLTEKLPYLQDLGVTAVWLLPFSPSPWRDDGYDVSDYTDVHPAYGTLKDFQAFMKEAHRRGIRVIAEVVVNHTSDQHPWFQRARRSPPGSKFRDFYVWSDSTDLYKEARIIFKDFETSNWTYDPVAKAHYWHRFYSHQPDLNFDSPHVQQAVISVADFWFDMGVDAFRLDAIPYLYERPGTNCENLPETHAFLKKFRAHVDSKYKNRMLLAEANQWPDDSIQYFGDGDECQMAFHFPVMPRLFMATRMEDRYPIIEILEQTPAIPENCQWAMFLRNHDELTLEMVTDEERDYMYRTYAEDKQMRINLGIRRRLAPLLGNNRRRIELLNALLFSLPGTPVIYYGDEIGMGDNIYLGDRNGVRTPMQWSADRNAGFSRSSPQKLYLPITADPEYHYETINVEAQQNNPNSLLWWTKRLIQQRKRYKAFGRGSIEFLHPENRKVLAFYRRFHDENLLIVANLSRFPQYVELDLRAAKGMSPVELFGGSEFPPIGDAPYGLTLHGHSFYWLALQPCKTKRESVDTGPRRLVHSVQIDSWDHLVSERNLGAFTRLLPEFLQTRRWYRSKTRTIRNVAVSDIVEIAEADSLLIFAHVEFTDGDPEDYILPITVARREAAAKAEAEFSDTIVARLQDRNGESGVLYGALWNQSFADSLLGAIARNKRLRGRNGDLVATHNRAFRTVWGGRHPDLHASVSKAEQSNSSILYGERFILKLFRKVEAGIHPDVEVSRFLTEHGFAHTPPMTGSIEYRPYDGEPMTVAILQGFVANQGDAWSYTLDSLSRFFESALTHSIIEPSLSVKELVGTYGESARLLGQRTAEMHLALASDDRDPAFAPEPFTDHYRMGLFHGFLSQTNRSFQLLRAHGASDDAQALLEKEAEVRERFRSLRDNRINATRIRTHGDFHLGQVLYTGKDFSIIDFEGEPARPLSERRLKRSPLRDVAGMLRSFQYAAFGALFGQVPGVTPQPQLEAWANLWVSAVSDQYLAGYLATAGTAHFIPQSPEELQILMEVFLLEKAVYEVTYELNNRPDWVRIPIRGILRMLSDSKNPPQLP